MQILYISNRPDVLAETWAHVRHFMAFVDRAVVVVPGAEAARFRVGDDVTVLTDEQVTGRSAAELARLDHVSRNIAIRRGLLASGEVDDRFLLSDDDYRPLKPTTVDVFVRDGREVGYYCYDLADWPGDTTDFDRAQHVTHQLLTYEGADHLCYGSHQPQVMSRDLLSACFAVTDRLSDTTLIDEWSLYFNLGRHLDPDRFAEPEPFQTLCWPQYPNEWPLWVRPPAYRFENYYPDLYRAGHLFDGLPTALDPATAERTNVEKILRWSDFGRHSARLDFSTGVVEPWTQGSVGRRLTFGFLRRLRKGYDYVSMDERTRLTQMAGAISRLEDDVRRLGGR